MREVKPGTDLTYIDLWRSDIAVGGGNLFDVPDFELAIYIGRRFGFEGDELAEFVRLCVLRLLEAGAVPVRHSPQGGDALAGADVIRHDEGEDCRRNRRVRRVE